MSVAFEKPSLWQRVVPLLRGFDGPLAFVVFLLAAAGLTAMYSVGFDAGTRFADHGRNMLIAGFILFVVAQIPPQRLMSLAVPLYTLGVALLLTAAATLYKAVRGKTVPRQIDPAALAHAARPRHWSLPVLLGAVIGGLVSLTSVGAGAIGVTALMLLYPRLPLPRIVAADIAYAVPLTLVAGLGHASIGSVDWRLLGLLLTGSLPGIWLGTRLVSKTPDRVIRSLLSLLLAYAGVKLISI